MLNKCSTNPKMLRDFSWNMSGFRPKEQNIKPYSNFYCRWINGSGRHIGLCALKLIKQIKGLHMTNAMLIAFIHFWQDSMAPVTAPVKLNVPMRQFMWKTVQK